MMIRADWAAWHLPDGPVGPASRWAATSNVDVRRTVNGKTVGMEGREWSERQSQKKRGKEGVE